MLETILSERENKLEKEFLKLNVENVDIMADVHNTDTSDITGDMLVRFYVDVDDHIYNIFVKEKHFKNEESETENILYKNMAESVIDCIKKDLASKKELLFLVASYNTLAFDCYNANETIITTNQAVDIYNTVITDYNNRYCLVTEKLNTEQFEKEFQAFTFKIGETKVINIFNLMYRLSVY